MNSILKKISNKKSSSSSSSSDNNNTKKPKKSKLRLFKKRGKQICETPQAMNVIETPHYITEEANNINKNANNASNDESDNDISNISNISNSNNNNSNNSSNSSGAQQSSSNKAVVEDDDSSSEGDLHRTEEESTPYSDVLQNRYKYHCDVGSGAFGQVIKVKSIWNNKHRDIQPGDVFAVKVIRNVFKSTSQAKRLLRELRILRELHVHEAIVELCDIIPPANPKNFKQLCLVFEYFPTDLKKVFKSNQYFKDLHIQYIMYQLLLGLKYMHSADVVHRDLKPDNILINEECTLRICDFGLARGTRENMTKDNPTPKAIKYLANDEEDERSAREKIESKNAATAAKAGNTADDQKENSATDTSTELARKKALKRKQRQSFKNKKKKKMVRGITKHVVTRWYRAPEVILLQQNRELLSKIDMWSAGCIFGELLQMHQENCPDYKRRRPLFPGTTCFPFSASDPFDYQNRTDQLRVVFNMIGTPSVPEIEKYEDPNVRSYLKSMDACTGKNFNNIFPHTSAVAQQGILLLQALLTFDVENRMSVNDALNSKYFNDVRDKTAETAAQEIRFEFEDIELDETTVRAMILDEILVHNPDYKSKWNKQLLRKKSKKNNNNNNSSSTAANTSTSTSD